jgi:NTP pyrophosphatase (non-canonical NTP hydrolase)
VKIDFVELLVNMRFLLAKNCSLVKKKNLSKFSNHKPFMTLAEAQAIVDNWIKTTGIRYYSELTNMAILTEEVGEVARIMARKYGDQSFKASDKEVDLADEMADVLFVLIALANQTGVNLTEALEKNLDKKTKRDADRHANNEKLKS